MLDNQLIIKHFWYPEPHLKILKSIKGDEIENYLILFIEHCLSVIYVISYNLIAFSRFARYLADVVSVSTMTYCIYQKNR